MLDDDFMGFHGLESGITSRILFQIIVGGVSHPSDVKNYPSPMIYPLELGDRSPRRYVAGDKSTKLLEKIPSWGKRGLEI